MAKTQMPRLAVLGAGPIGLEAALYAATLQLPVTIYEQGRVGEYLRRWGHVRMFTPFGMNCTSLGRKAIRQANATHEFPGDGAGITGREYLTTYLEPLAQSDLLQGCVRTDTQVLHVGRRGLLKEEYPRDARRARQPFVLLVREGKNRERIEEADVVVDCTGTYGLHRWMGTGGIPAIGELAAEAQIAYTLDDVLGERRATYAGKNILVFGGGYSAATTVCNLATLAEHHADTWVIWLARTSSTQPLARIGNDPLRERDRLAVRANTLATRGDGNVEFHNQAVVDSIDFLGADKGFRLSAHCAGKARAWDVDRLVGNVGYGPDRALYRELQIHENHLTLGPMDLATALLKQPPDAAQVVLEKAEWLRTPEPNFYILGVKSFGRNAHFLLRTGFTQVRHVFQLITGNSEINLYK
jgi:thioredoxin reductase